MNFSRVRSEINLDNLLFNLHQMRDRLPKNSKIMAVIKADGYGAGADVIAKVLEKEDCVGGFCTATVDEAFKLRTDGVVKPILVLGYIFESDYKEMIEKEIRPAVYSFEMAKEISDRAVLQNKDCNIHIKIDTGMGRIGFQPDKVSFEEIKKISELPRIVMEGIFTHFARCDEKDKKYADKQQDIFNKVIKELSDIGVEFKHHHSANSAAILEYPPAYSTLVRAGVTLYGMWPSDDVDHSFPLKKVTSIKSSIIHIKKVPAGFAIGYGGTYVTDRETLVATVSIGYADGMPRSLSNKGYVLVRGRKVPIIGRICMDQMMIDVSSVPEAKVLDTVTVIGRDGDEEISMEEVGSLSGRFNYELACLFGNKRIPRIYYLDSKEYLRTDGE